ncbi:MAG TPA: DUF4349 domain-containing protein [Luteimonas sp.]|nr:DUF4349 domain-containing protein [Luteimonas sp.]HRO28204.1 DUF4349 domain-containing protein [Luteimonas sp.]HRP71215.1 DUF4349 domain-containing protein [Luteimonas sp.]
MTFPSRILLACGVALLAVACSDQSSHDEFAYGGAAQAPMPVAEAAADAAGENLASFLAYEHDATVTLPAAQIQPRLQEAQAACSEGRFGDCVVLTVRQQGGDRPSATLGVRIVPTGVEPMIALASADAELGSRSTRAEDLAVVVRDNTLAQERLRKERERLQEFQSRRDLAVADMIALSRQLAETEAQLEAAERAGAQHRRRIDTQLLTLQFRPTSSQESRSEIWLAIRDSGRTLSMGVAWTIRAVAFLLPVLVVVAVLVAMVRRWRRRRK